MQRAMQEVDRSLPASPTSACRLCGLPVRGRSDGFCCLGCHHVFEILKEKIGVADSGLMRRHDFYRRMQIEGIVPGAQVQPRPAGKPVQSHASSRSDAPGLLVPSRGQSSALGQAEVPPDGSATAASRLRDPVAQHVFRVDGMWCPSCAWVIERVLRRQEGVVEAAASFSSDRVRVIYQNRVTGPERLTGVVEGLGYRVADPAEARAGRRLLDRQLVRLGIAAFLSMNIMTLSFAIYRGLFAPVSESSVRMLGAPVFILCTLVVFYGGFPILWKAWQAARARAFVMETLIAVGTLAAYGLSLTNLIRGDPHLYFDAASMLVTLVLLGAWLEGRLRHRASQRVEEIYELVPAKARLVLGPGERYVSSRAVVPGDRVRVVHGEPVPVDGVVVGGRGTVDNSKLTGEAVLHERGPGDAVLAASRLVSGELTVRATAASENSAIGRMIALMEQALLSRNPAERAADRLMAWFVPAVLLTALATGTVLTVMGRTPQEALLRAITVLAIACPCALGIATPLARVAAVGRAWLDGILITNTEGLEQACRITSLVIDKTGTATHGTYQIVAIETADAAPEDLLATAAAVEAGLDHPAARAIREHAACLGVAAVPAVGVVVMPGLGVRGEVRGRLVLVGSQVLMEQEGLDLDAGWVEQARSRSGSGATLVFVAVDGRLAGILVLGDSLREDLPAMITALRAAGVYTYLVSGDTPAATEHAARQLGVDRYAGNLLPADKVQVVRALQAEGHRVGMAGDGANDAAALAAADVGFATGDALTVTKNASDLVLLSFTGTRLLAAMELSRLTLKTIGSNLALSLLYNLIAVPLAVSGLVNPVIAVALMVASSLTVVGNSARLARSPKGSSSHRARVVVARRRKPKRDARLESFWP